MNKKIRILWNRTVNGSIKVKNGHIAGLSTAGAALGNEKFTVSEKIPLIVDAADVVLSVGSGASIIHVECDKPFSFFLRDVNKKNPIFIPEYGVVVTEENDAREYDVIAEDIGKNVRRTRIQEMQSGSETTYTGAAAKTRNIEQSPTWLGISRDFRTFEVTLNHASPWFDAVKPKHHGYDDVVIPELSPDKPIRYVTMTGRGIGPHYRIRRSLEKGILPILNVVNIDEEIEYEMKYFVTTEVSQLTENTLRGTDAFVADMHGAGNMLTPEQKQKTEPKIKTETCREEETVMYIRINAVNRSGAPHYAFLYLPSPEILESPSLQRSQKNKVKYEDGMGQLQSGNVFLVAACNGKPIHDSEMTVLLQPSEKAVFIYKIPHTPISRERAEALAKVDYDRKLAECISFWEKKFHDAAAVSVPEKIIDEHIKAGLLHIDLAYYGLEPDKPVLPIVGVYTAIGSESSPGIQYLDSIGKNKLAERAIRFFIGKQHDDGFMQNFGGYMLETGSVLWTLGEHYKYTRDIGFIKDIQPNIIKAGDYLIKWRRKNQDEKFRGNGYGMIDGKVADPEDPFHSYMLNAGAYAGLAALGVVLEKVDPSESQKFKTEAEALKADIRASYAKSLAEAPVMPLLNGCWAPVAAPWTESIGALCLYADKADWYTHGTFLARDTLCGNTYLFIQGVLDPKEYYGDFFLNAFCDNFFQDNTAFSQPYYSVHPYAHAIRGETGPYLREFYTNLTALADRETHSFWEHLFHASPHKLHEETWFLMRCRWMLYLEDGAVLKIFPVAPRAWFEEGKVISVKGVKSYFGELDFSVVCGVGSYTCSISIKSKGHPAPEKILFRIPHPKNIKTLHSSEGLYCPSSESVVFDNPRSHYSFEVNF
jgi:hypothetical protein